MISSCESVWFSGGFGTRKDLEISEETIQKLLKTINSMGIGVSSAYWGIWKPETLGSLENNPGRYGTTVPPWQATGPPQSGAGVGVGMLMALWFYGVMVLCFYGFMVLWFYGFMVL